MEHCRWRQVKWEASQAHTAAIRTDNLAGEACALLERGRSAQRPAVRLRQEGAHVAGSEPGGARVAGTALLASTQSAWPCAAARGLTKEQQQPGRPHAISRRGTAARAGAGGGGHHPTRQLARAEPLGLRGCSVQGGLFEGHRKALAVSTAPLATRRHGSHLRWRVPMCSGACLGISQRCLSEAGGQREACRCAADSLLSDYVVLEALDAAGGMPA